MNQPAPVSPRSSRGLSARPTDPFSIVWALSGWHPGASRLPSTAGLAVRDKLATKLKTLLVTHGMQSPPGQTDIVHHGEQSWTFPYGRTRVDLQPPSLGATVGTWHLRPAVTPNDLKEALQDLEDALHEANDEGFPPPTEIARTNAARLIRTMYGIHACRFEVYPTVDGEVAMDASAADYSVVLLCEADGGALCLANTGATHRRAHYSDADQLPDGFLREALAELFD